MAGRKIGRMDPSMPVTALLVRIRTDKKYSGTDLLSAWVYQGSANYTQQNLKKLVALEHQGVWMNKLDASEDPKQPHPWKEYLQASKDFMTGDFGDPPTTNFKHHHLNDSPKSFYTIAQEAFRLGIHTREETRACFQTQQEKVMPNKAKAPRAGSEDKATKALKGPFKIPSVPQDQGGVDKEGNLPVGRPSPFQDVRRSTPQSGNEPSNLEDKKEETGLDGKQGLVDTTLATSQGVKKTRQTSRPKFYQKDCRRKLPGARLSNSRNRLTQVHKTTCLFSWSLQWWELKLK